MSGRPISMMDALMVAIRTPSVVLDRAIHLYLGPAPDEAGGIDIPPDQGLAAWRGADRAGAVPE
jgi:hypothetical protein